VSLATELQHPTVIVGAHKGGAIKTATAVALAERLAWPGHKILLLTSDDQYDARFRLGIPASAPQVATVSRGQGIVTVRGARRSKVVELLYQTDPGDFHAVVVDTAPSRTGGNLPGVFLVAPVSNQDGARNLALMLRSTPDNVTTVVFRFVETKTRVSPAMWGKAVKEIYHAAGDKNFTYLEDPVHHSDPISRDAHDRGESVWTLPRRNNTMEYLNTVNELAELFWRWAYPEAELPPMPRSRTTDVYVEGWSDDE